MSRNALIAAVLLAGIATPAAAQQQRMSFFITSVGPGNGAALGGHEGADRHCQMLADAVGHGDRTWRAYLSTTATGGEAPAPAAADRIRLRTSADEASRTDAPGAAAEANEPHIRIRGAPSGMLRTVPPRIDIDGVLRNDSQSINARDRIGSGPWYNAKGVLIAESVADLHGENAKWTKETALNEKGEVVNGRGDQPNRHDILTGSLPDGTASDQTCDNWTSSGEGAAMVGHHDKIGGGANPNSWNSAHASRGCSQENLRGSGGDGLFYCFAIEG